MTQSWPMLYTRTASGKINYWHIWTDGPSVNTRWGNVGGRELTDSYRAEAKNVGRANATTPEYQAKLEAQSKFDEKLRLKYVYSEAEARAQLNIKPMLAYPLDKKRLKKLSWPVDAQPKLNGVRCFAYNMPDGSVRLMSRGGKDYTLPHVQQSLRGRIPDGHVLDGELYAHGVPLQTIRSYIETPQEGTALVRLHVYDYTTINPSDPVAQMTWRERFTIVHAWMDIHQNELVESVYPVVTLDVSDYGDLKLLHDQWVDSGYEGAIVRAHSGLYRLGARSTELLKLKEFLDQEFPVVGWSVGKDNVILFRCLQEDGREFEVRPMGTVEERAAMLEQADSYLGRQLMVRYQERSEDNIPMHGRGVAFREDGE